MAGETVTKGGKAMNWLKLLSFAIPLVSAGCSKLSGGTSQQQQGGGCQDCNCVPVAWEPSDVQLRMFSLSCYYRESYKVAPQWLDRDMTAKAQEWAERMAATGTLEHSGWRVSENIARGHKTAKEAFAAWRSSPRHRSNLLGPHQRCGFGHAVSRTGTAYWVAMYDAPGDATDTGATGAIGADGGADAEDSPVAGKVGA